MDAPLPIVRLYVVQRGKCFHCGTKMLETPARKKPNGSYNGGWTREHVVPISKGGRRGNSNVVLAHIKCNGKRGNKDFNAAQMQKAESIWELARGISDADAMQTLQRVDLNKPWIHVYKFHPHENEPKFIPPVRIAR